MIYFDNNATTALAPEIQELYLELLPKYGNASSIHGPGREARRLLNEARESMAAQLKISEASLIFTSGATESINAAMLGTFLPKPEGKHLIVSRVEHAAVLETAQFLTSLGVEVSYLDVDGEGRLDVAQLHSLMRHETKMIAVMLANNEIGNIYPVKQIGEIARNHKISYLCDAVQAVGRLPIDLSHLPVDFLVASAHKFHGPKGVGLLYVRPGVECQPLIHGGRQERGKRAGTENVAGIVAMSKAFALADERMFQDERKIGALRDKLQHGLLEKIPQVHIHGDIEHRLYNTLNFRIAGISGETLLMNLDMAGIAASVGSACDSGSLEASHVLLAMGIDAETAIGGLRFSLSRYNSDVEVERVVEVLEKLVTHHS